MVMVAVKTQLKKSLSGSKQTAKISVVQEPKKTHQLTYVDLFSGAGGLSLGFEKAGFQNLFSIDNDPTFCETYRQNFPHHSLLEQNIEQLDTKTIHNLVKGRTVTVVVGGPPCQGFSMAGNIGRRFLDDPRNHLFRDFARVVGIIQPEYFVMENVARLYTHNKGKTRQEIIDAMEAVGYHVECRVVNAADFGVAQVRSRVLFIGRRKEGQILFPEPQEKERKTVKQAIGDLPKLAAGEMSSLPNHIAMNHSAQMLEKMRYVKDGGTRVQIPAQLRPLSGDVRKYIRYDSKKPSVCVTGDMRKVFHYKQNRALTVRELARLQSFPDSFVFYGKAISQQQQVGNAVPPLLAQSIAQTVKKMKTSKVNQPLQSTYLEKALPKINFIGNKEKLAEWICNQFPSDATSVFDAFSGGSSVSYQAKKLGLQVYSNDILKINYLLSKALIENKKETLSEKDVATIFSGKPQKGFMYKHYANVFFWPEECMELDLYRKNIGTLPTSNKQALALVLLRRAMIRKMPYSRFDIDWKKIKQLRDENYSYQKYGRKRAYHNKSFKYHFLHNLEAYNQAVFDNGRANRAFNDDVFKLLGKVKADVIYLDPPYTGTMNNYFGFYGALDNFTLSKVTKPFANNFIDKNSSIEVFDKLFANLKNYRYWYLSYNNSSFPTKEQLMELLKKYSSRIQVLEKPHSYKLTGKNNKTKNTEYLFIVENF
jgi:DNA-cytosine methyltransferase